jgi:hypothetical protein
MKIIFAQPSFTRSLNGVRTSFRPELSHAVVSDVSLRASPLSGAHFRGLVISVSNLLVVEYKDKAAELSLSERTDHHFLVSAGKALREQSWKELGRTLPIWVRCKLVVSAVNYLRVSRSFWSTNRSMHGRPEAEWDRFLRTGCHLDNTCIPSCR